MPGLQLYQTAIDELELVTSALEIGCRLVPASNNEGPEPTELSTIGAYIEARALERMFYFLHEAFTRLPLSIGSSVKAGKTTFHVRSSQGGPFVEYLGGGLFHHNETHQIFIRPGFLEFARHYWNADLSRRYDSPPELEEFFKKLARSLKANHVRIKPGKSAFWLGRDAEVQLKQGAKLVGYEEWQLT